MVLKILENFVSNKVEDFDIEVDGNMKMDVEEDKKEGIIYLLEISINKIVIVSL